MIGEGTFGRVYRGLDRRLARPVAVKVIKPWWAEDPDWVRSFEREAQLLASVSDPGIVQIFDVGSAPEGLYYVAEMVDGESLVTRLREGPLEPERARVIAEQLARALGSAHARRVVHRDVKPANVLISRNGHVKVADFGVAHLAEGSTDGAGGTIVGTPRYMAPEQARGGAVSPATDVYGVGVILYEMLAGHPPFEAGSSVELALRHVHDEPPSLPPNVPEALSEIVEQALAKDPAARFRDGGELAAALREAEVSETVGAPARGRGATLVAAAPSPPPTRVLPRERNGAVPADGTRVGSAYAPRRNVNPSERRQRIALFGLAAVLVAALVLGAIALMRGHVKVPRLVGLTSARAAGRLRHDGLRASFAHRYSGARRGTVISQSPRPGASVTDGSSIQVVLSAGPAPVAVPTVLNTTATAAQDELARVNLHASVIQVPAPGISAGLVTRQEPGPGAKVAPGSTVALQVAETPGWRGLTTFTGRRSVPFRIRGSRWQLVYSMSYQGTCTLIFICNGPTATITNLSTGATVDQFDLSDGSGHVKGYTSGAGVYQVTISPGSDTATWSMRAEDYY